MESIDKDRIIEMAWEDRTPFEAIKKQFGIPEQDVIVLMRNELKHSSFQLWRKRVSGRKTKHPKKYGIESQKFKCDLQKPITLNKISKRK